MKSLSTAFTIGIAALMSGSVTHAHHSTAMYDMGKTVELEGTLRKVQISNPHSWFFVVVTNASGVEETWALEGASAAETGRRTGGGNTKEYFAAGQKVKISLHPVRDGRTTGELLRMSFADGRNFGGGSNP
ncbi:MAG: DUF6152 family protein [Steroidobacteraceae bacterium]